MMRMGKHLMLKLLFELRTFMGQYSKGNNMAPKNNGGYAHAQISNTYNSNLS